MANIDKLNNIFVEVFNADVANLNENYTKENVEEWDSVHQLSIISMMEEEFDLMLDPEDIMACTSYEAAKEILTKNDVEL